VDPPVEIISWDELKDKLAWNIGKEHPALVRISFPHKILPDKIRCKNNYDCAESNKQL
jgi:hypothetical protein